MILRNSIIKTNKDFKDICFICDEEYISVSSFDGWNGILKCIKCKMYIKYKYNELGTCKLIGDELGFYINEDDAMNDIFVNLYGQQLIDFKIYKQYDLDKDLTREQLIKKISDVRKSRILS